MGPQWMDLCAWSLTAYPEIASFTLPCAPRTSPINSILSIALNCGNEQGPLGFAAPGGNISEQASNCEM